MHRSILAAGALLIPALTFLACSDSTNQNPVTPDTPSLGTPSTPTTTGVRITDVHKLRFGQPAEGMALVTQPGPLAAHGPEIPGMKIRCLDGAAFGFPPATSDPFKAPRDHGCELNTMAGGAAIALPFQNLTRGKKVANTTRLDFYYAGGPQNGGAPRFSLFTDFCRPAAVTTSDPNLKPCPGGYTDGEWDETLFIDQSNCNDGDPYVGAVLLKGQNAAKTDATCPVFETYGPDGNSATPDTDGPHANWAAYVAAHPNDRFARDFGPANGDALADNFIIADVPVHYLVYRINMKATGT